MFKSDPILKFDPNDSFRKSRDCKQRDRLKAVLLRSENWTTPMISQALRLHESTVSQHLEDYLNGKLKNESGGSDSLLNEQHTIRPSAKVMNRRAD